MARESDDGVKVEINAKTKLSNLGHSVTFKSFTDRKSFQRMKILKNLKNMEI